LLADDEDEESVLNFNQQFTNFAHLNNVKQISQMQYKSPSDQY